MTKPHPTLVLLMLLFLGFSLAVPAEDLTETAYNESEGQPCESSPPIFNLMPSAAASPMQRHESPTGRQPAISNRVTTTRTDTTGGHRSAGAQAALAFLCTLLC